MPIAGRAAQIVEQLEKTTGARVELGNFHFEWWHLRARFDGLTLHGREPAGTPPLFHADQLQVDVRVESFWGRKISLGSVEMSHFSAHVRVEPDGSTNIPGAESSGSPGKPASSKICFDLKIARLRLEDGEILWNDTRVPLVAEGGHFEFAMDYASDAGKPVYLGQRKLATISSCGVAVYAIYFGFLRAISVCGRIHFP